MHKQGEGGHTPISPECRLGATAGDELHCSDRGSHSAGGLGRRQDKSKIRLAG